MTQAAASSDTTAAPAQDAGPSGQRSVAGMLRSVEVDTRLLGMLLSLLVIWIGFDIWSGGLFMSPRNLWNLSVQTSVVAVMATGMVLIIVSRNIDLSVGSLVGVIGMSMALLQARVIPTTLDLGFEQPYTWIVTVGFGLGLGAALGGLAGVLVAYVGIPSFVVTLGGLLVWRSVTIILSAGQTVSQLDPTYTLLGGGPRGSVGDTVSWILGVLVCIAIVYGLISSRRRRKRYGFPVRPWWAEVVIGVVGCLIVLWAVWMANSYPWPKALASQFAVEHGLAEPEGGLIIPTGIANPVLIMLGVAMLMTVLATRRRLGRYVFAIGGNPEAAELSGINTRRIIMWTFVIMGFLAAVGAIISTARLQSATSGSGTGLELQVIAAAVIGGTSFAGGIGTIPGAILGALIIQSLVSGMQLLRFDNSVVDIAVGIVLVVAVGIDTVVRRRAT
jgi:D-xylose transport system permease protein